MDFFKKLNFSSSNEDGDTEITTLAGADRILCITGSGTRPLDLLQTQASDIIAFDVNPAQNALLALKLAAIAELDHASFLAFLGITDGDRAALYQHISPRLSPDMRSYWDARTRLIAKGVWYAGKWEKVLRWNAWFLRLTRGRSIDQLMQAATIADQARIWEEQFNDKWLKRAIEMIGRDWIWRWVMREPAGEFLPGPTVVGDRLAADFERAAGSFLFRDSDFATLIFRGKLSPTGGLPAHLRPENYQHTKENIERIRIVEGDLTDIRKAGISHVDGFSVSDFGSYTDTAAYAACWQGILDVAAPNAAFCERIFMNDLELPFERLREDKDLSARLTLEDKAIIYRVRAGVISGP